MNTRDIDNRISIITPSDTLTDFMTKCNDNFTALVEMGGGMKGADGEKGSPGSPTKPKVPIHVWSDGYEYEGETPTADGKHVLNVVHENLLDPKYQEGHLILLQNAHIYILTTEDGDEFRLKPRFLLGLQSYDINDVINGKNAYIHIAYANSPYGDGFITDQQLRGDSQSTESVATFNLLRAGNNPNAIINNRSYIGVYSSYNDKPSDLPEMYTWSLMRGPSGDKGDVGEKGDRGEQGEKGEKGDGYTGQLYSIDLEGDMSTMTIGIDRTPLKNDDYCECILHAYYGNANVQLDPSDIIIKLRTNDTNYYLDGDKIYLSNTEVGKIEIRQYDITDIRIKFIPYRDFVFPKETLIFSINVVSDIVDRNDGNTYTFTRDIAWMVKGLVSNFKLEIAPQYRTIKLFEDGVYSPDKLLVNVYKIEDGKREIFDYTNTNFTLLYKNYSSNTWNEYKDENNGNGVSTFGVSCLEFKLVKNYQSTDPNNPEEIWDYEDVWVVSDGKSAHYYHADLGNMESMMVVTTGRQIEVKAGNDTVYCVEFKDKSEYSIIFYPQLFDGTTKCGDITSVSIGTNSGETYYTDGSFIRELKKNDNGDWQLTVTRVPYGVDVIPMNIVVEGKLTNSTEPITDSVPFNIYISTISDIYTIETTPTIYNTTTGKTGDKIECKVFKNNTLIETENLGVNGLILEYTIYGEGNVKNDPLIYDEPIVYAIDNDIKKDDFTASDVAIEFTLYYIKPDVNQEILKATVPLIKDGIDGKDGDAWQYIFCRSPKYPFGETGISDPSKWINAYGDHDHIEEFKDSNNEYFGEYEENYNKDKDKFVWYDDHQGVDSEFKYEYQSYRKWDKTNKCWGVYTYPTLYSNYSEDGKDGSWYSVLLSNPVAVIPVGDDWSTDENNNNQGDSTLVYLYNNTLNIPTDSNITIEISLDKTDVNYKFFNVIDGNKVTFTPKVGEDVFTFTENTPYKLPIYVEYDLKVDNDNNGTPDCFITTINWTLTPIKGLEDIEVFVDHRVINTSRNNTDNIRVGYYISSSNGGKKFIGKNSPEININNYQIKITNNLNDIINADTVSNWENVSFNFKNGNYYVVLVKSDGKSIIDYTTITTVSDGVSTTHLVLSQDYIALPRSSNGDNSYIIHEDYNEPIELRMLLYNGNDLIENEITYKFYIGEIPIQDDHISKNNNSFFIEIEGIKDYINEGGTNIVCEAIYNGVSYSKILFVELKETPYELEFNKNVLTRSVNSNKITDVSLLARVKYWINGGWIYTTTGVLKAIAGDEEYEFTSIDGSDKRILYIANAESNLKNYTGNNIRISYYDNNVEQTYEILDIINGEYIDKKQYIYCNSPYNPWKSDNALGLVNPTTISTSGGYNDYNTEGRWSPLRSGVDPINKYEYMSERTWNKSTNQWGKYGAPVLITTYAENGSDGKSYSVLLSNPVAVIPVGDDWSTDENNNNQSDSTFVYLYENTTDVSTNSNIYLDENDVNYKFFKVEGNKVTFTPKVGADVFTFTENTSHKLPIKLYYNSEFETTINWTLTPVKGLEDIEVFVSNHIFNITETSTQTFEVGYYLISPNGNRTFINNSENDRGYQIKISVDNISNLDSINAVSNWSSVTYEFNDTKKYYIVLVKSDGKSIIDYADITFIKDGSTPEAPEAPVCTSVSIIGYSLNSTLDTDSEFNENGEKDNGKWYKSVNELGTIGSGVTIYMLNKYTWSVGDPTLFVTSTLSGTQGIDGKSRVLFYLGSFKDGTLTGESVMGHLTDERCDYYIDAGEKAWMRIGIEDKDTPNKQGIPGFPNGSSNPKECWVESSKVGFLQAGAIHADMINAGSITAESALITRIQGLDIIGDTITGKTIQSGENFNVNTPTWKIDSNGAGWLAQKNIEWDKNGKLTIGGINNIATINGDLVINNTVGIENGEEIEKTSLVLCANHIYGNLFENDDTAESTFGVNPYGDEEEPQYINKNETKYITLSSGHNDVLYKWRLIAPKKSDDIVVPKNIFIKENIIDEQNKTFFFRDYPKRIVGKDYPLPIGTELPNKTDTNFTVADSGEKIYFDDIEIYYYNENTDKYILFDRINSCSTRQQFNMFKTVSGFDMYYLHNTLIVEIDQIKYNYVYVESEYNDTPMSDYITHLNFNQQIETANTLILSDGSIYTNSIHARNGYFYGEICSTGEFKGLILNSTTKNSSIYESNIEEAEIKISNINFSNIEDSNINKSSITNSNISINDSNYTIKALKSDNTPFFKLSIDDSNKCINNLAYTTSLRAFAFNSNKTGENLEGEHIIRNGIFAEIGHTLKINGLHLKAYMEQPKHPLFNNLAEDMFPSADIYWRYKGETNINNYKFICQIGKKGYTPPGSGDHENYYTMKCTLTNDNDVADFECDTAKNITFEYSISKKGEIEILAIIQWLSYANRRKTSTATFTFMPFNIVLDPSSCKLPPIGSIVDINSTQLIITANDGGRLTTNGDEYVIVDSNNKTQTLSGALTLLSQNGAYGIMITNNGVKYKDSKGSWVSFSGQRDPNTI